MHDLLTDRQTDRQTKTDKQTEKQSDVPTDMQTVKLQRQKYDKNREGDADTQSGRRKDWKWVNLSERRRE